MEVVTVEPPTLSAALVEGIRKIHELQTELEEALRSDPYHYNDPNLTEEEQKEKRQHPCHRKVECRRSHPGTGSDCQFN